MLDCEDPFPHRRVTVPTDRGDAEIVQSMKDLYANDSLEAILLVACQTIMAGQFGDHESHPRVLCVASAADRLFAKGFSIITLARS